MATKTIAWKTGGGNITLTYGGQGNGSVSVSSTENETSNDRSQTIKITTTKGSPTKTVSIQVKQLGKRYDFVNYIQSTGKQYINTGCLLINSNSRIVCDFAFTSLTNGTALLGSQSSSGQPYSVAFYTGNVLKFYCGSASGILPISGISANSRNVLDMSMVNNLLTVTFNGNEQSSYFGNTVNNGFPIALFANNAGGTFKQNSYVRMYSCKIYIGGELVRDYVPARDSSGIYGLYDRVNSQFYKSASSTNFSGG